MKAQRIERKSDMKTPTPSTYTEWKHTRAMNTRNAMKQKTITGKQVKDLNLSLSILYKNGYVLNTKTDILEKSNV